MKTLNEETLQRVREFNITYQQEYGISPSYRQIMNALNLGSLATVRRYVKAGVIPPDKGGYTVLDIVFDGQMEAELIVTPFEIKDVKGKTIKGNTYSVRSYDEDGTVYECPIKPARTSDKSFLNMLLR